MKKDQKNSDMSNHILYINVKHPEWKKHLPDFEDISGAALDKTFNHLNSKLDLLNTDKPFVITLTLVDDPHIRQLNKDYRNLDKPTNVLSFAMIDDENFEQNSAIFDEIELGDIIISLDTLQKEAKEKNISLSDHYSHLFVHGILHLLGYDHIDDTDADQMENIEINILKELKINNPYE